MSVFKNETENIDPNERSENVSDVNNVANGGSKNELFASLFDASSRGQKKFSIGGDEITPSSLFPPTEHGVFQSKEEKQALSSSSID